MGRGARQLGSSLRALAIDFENRDLALLGIARIGTSYVNWSFTIALAVYGFDAHGAVGVGVIALVRLLPGAIASPIGGLLGDRYSRRAVLVGSSLAMTVVLVGATVAAGANAPANVVFVFPALFAIALSGYGPAESALFPVLARTPQELSASNVSHSAMENGGNLLAAIATGILLATTSTDVAFGVAAAVSAAMTAVLFLLRPDSRPEYEDEEGEIAGAFGEIRLGLRSLWAHPALRLASATLVLLLFFEGFAEVAVVLMALELLHLEEGAVGFLNASWGIGALVGGAGLAVMLDRGRLVVAIAGGSLVLGAATMLPGIWPEPATAYLGWFALGIGFTFVEVAAKTLMQRLGDDETMGRVLSVLESGGLAAMGLGTVGAVVLVELLGERGMLIALGAVMPAFVLACWTRLRSHEIGAPVAEEHYMLLRGNSIFAPLPMATLERLSHDLSPVEMPAGEDVIVQGETGDRFYVIEEGEVEVFENGAFRRNEGPGESFGEIALLHEVPRTATVRTTKETRLLMLEQDQFLLAVTGHRRSHQVAHGVVDSRWPGAEETAAPSRES